MSLYFYNKTKSEKHYYQMATPLTTEEVLELVLDENDDHDDVDELYYLGSDDELEFNNFDE